MYQLGIKNAFLHGNLQEEVYMNQPLGYVVSGSENLVCRFKKTLYRLKHLELGLISLVQFLLSMAFDTLCPIIQCLAGHPQEVLLC